MLAITKSVGVLLLLVCTFLVPGAVYASGISPASGDVRVMQGESADHTISIINNEDENISYSVRPIGVLLGEAPTDVAFYELSDEVASWVRVSESQFSLQPNDEKEIKVTVAPGIDASAQVLVVGIQVVEDARDASGIQVGSGFVSLLFVSVGEGLSEDYEFLAFSSSRNFVTDLPVSFALTVRNNGDRIVQPQGTIDVVNVFGKVVESYDLNPGDKRVIKDQARTFVTVWDTETGVFSTGVYKVQLRVAPWLHGEEFMEELTVVYVSKRTVVLLSAFVLLLILILRYSSVLKRRV